MKILATVRTRNEERNIERFVMSYQWTDGILVADGGSEDNTVQITKHLPKTKLRHFKEKKKMQGGLWRNPEAEHINFLIDWAIDEGADWVIFDDCDCFPNYLLKDDALEMFYSTNKKYIFAVRLYLYLGKEHFPKLAKPGGDWEPSLWAWNVSTKLRFENTGMAFKTNPYPPLGQRLNLLPPYCLLHDAWPTPEVCDKKMNFYRNSGQIPGIQHPTNFGGPLKPLPEWAHE